MTRSFTRSFWLALSCVLLAASARAQSSISIAPEYRRAFTLTAGFAGASSAGNSPGATIGFERRLGADHMGREIGVRVRGGVERTYIGASADDGVRDGYATTRALAFGLSRQLLPGSRTGFDPYVFGQLSHFRVESHGTTTRRRGLTFGAGLQIAPLSARRSVVVEAELGLSLVAGLPDTRSLGFGRLQIGYARRF